MEHWTDRITEEKLSRKADEEIQAQKDAIAAAAAPKIRSLLLKDLEAATERLGGIEGPVPVPLRSSTKFRTRTWPLHVVEFRFESARVLFRRYTMPSAESSGRQSDHEVRIMGEFNGEPWFDYQGQRLNTIAELSELLLHPLIYS